MKMKLLAKKKAVSSVIATVLIILITIAGISILAAVIIPFIKNSLNEGKVNCLTEMNEVSIVEKSCYTNSPEGTKLIVRAGNIDLVKAGGIYLSVENSEGNSDVYEIKEGERISEINNNAPLSLPQKGGGERTYNFNFKSEKIGLGIMNGDGKCGIAEEVKLNSC